MTTEKFWTRTKKIEEQSSCATQSWRKKSLKFYRSISDNTDSSLSKWFDQDVLQHMPQNNKSPTDVSGGKLLSVEELERAQRTA